MPAEPGASSGARPRAPHAIRVRGLDHLVLRVSDLEGMLRFYGEVLGCEVARRQDEIGLVQLRAGSALIDMLPVDGKLGRMGGAAPGLEGRNLDHFCLASTRSMKARSGPTWLHMGWPPGRWKSVSAPRARDRRSTCRTPSTIRSS